MAKDKSQKSKVKSSKIMGN